MGMSMTRNRTGICRHGILPGYTCNSIACKGEFARAARGSLLNLPTAVLPNWVARLRRPEIDQFRLMVPGRPLSLLRREQPQMGAVASTLGCWLD